MIEAKSLSKNYKDIKALSGVSFSIKKGEILGLLGPNGAGKSTVMNILTGCISPQSGSAEINGIDILQNPIKAKKQIGYLPEQPPLYNDMTVEEYLSFIYDLKKIKAPLKKEHIKNICEEVKISEVKHRLIKNLSMGFKQRVGFAGALIGNPPVLILDEPTKGLDPIQIKDIRTLIKNLAGEYTIILSSHILSEIQAVCDRIIVLDKGCIMADARPGEIKGKGAGQGLLRARIAGGEKAVITAVSAIKGVDKIMAIGKKEEDSLDFEIYHDKNTDIRRELFYMLAEKKWPILSLEVREENLEDVFISLIGKNGEAREAAQ